MCEDYLSLNPSPLRTQTIGNKIYVFRETDSTNNRAFQLGSDGTVVIADSQTAGRGRRGRKWSSAPGVGLWFSIKLIPSPAGLAFMAPLAVYDAVQMLCPAAKRLLRAKWPNDLWLKDKKFCGVLVEKRDNVAVVGIGVNVLHQFADFPTELRKKATSLLLELGTAPPRVMLLREILYQFDEKLQKVRKDESWAEIYCKQWFELCGIRGARVGWQGREGYVENMDKDGSLYVMQNNILHKVFVDETMQVPPGDCAFSPKSPCFEEE